MISLLNKKLSYSPAKVQAGGLSIKRNITMRDVLDNDHFKARLVALKLELSANSEAAKESRQAVELDQSKVGRLSRMDALQGQAMAQETERRRTIQLRRIDAALARLDEGEYGYCAACGEDIPQKRLDLDPATPTCVGCARR
jgi:DnaK suppressor protein